MKKDLQEIELTIKDVEDGIFAVSLVNSPAIEVGFVALSSEEISLKVIDEEKRIVVGYALIPDKRIYRRVEDKEFNIFFTAQTVKLASEMYMKQLNLNNVTVEHEKKVSDIGIIESWITEDKKHDKINLYGVEPIVGGWAIMMKVNNDEEWSKVKAGQYHGFSIEGKFAGFENLMSKNNKIDNMDLIEELKAIINAELKSENVELGLIDDAKSQIAVNKSNITSLAGLSNRLKTASKSFDDATKQLDSVMMDSMKLLSNNKDALTKISRTLSAINKIEKELGITQLPEGAELSKSYSILKKESDTLVDNINKYAKKAGLSYSPSKLPII